MTLETAIEEQPFVDGTNQAERQTAALDPAYAAVDERSLRDLLAFARDYAREIRFFEVVDHTLTASEDWSGFFEGDANLDEIVAFMNDPAAVSPAAVARYSRPHFALFLTFVQLLQLAQTQLNGLTKRHLDFYFQEVLKMAKRPGIPDKVNVLVDLAKRQKDSWLPAGTRLDAGADSAGQPLVYETDEDIVVNQAQVSRVSSLFIKQQVTDIRMAHLNLQADEPQEAFVNMLRMVLGDPQPTDDLPPYHSQQPEDEAEWLALLLRLRQFIRHVRDSQNGLSMTLSDFRRLMWAKLRRDSQQDIDDWNGINAYLQAAGENRTPDFELNPENIRFFEANARKATGNDLAFEDDALPEVESIYDLYERQDFEHERRYILDQLHFPTVKDFVEMMACKIGIDSDWFTINGILLEAGKRKAQTAGQERPDEDFIAYPARADKGEDAFEANLTKSLGENLFANFEEIDSVDDLYNELIYLEKYFYMSAEEFADVLLLPVQSETDLSSYQDDPAVWEAIYELLAKSYRQKIYAARSEQLKEILLEHRADLATAFEKMLAVAGDDFILERIKNNLGAADYQFLLETEQQIKAQTMPAPAYPEPDEQWDKVIRLLERGQRPYLPVPVAEGVQWRNVYPAEDATAVQISTSLTSTADQLRWETFGRAPLKPLTEPPEAEIGWAISSPLLDLQAGERVITVALGFHNNPEIDWQEIVARLPEDGMEVGADEQGALPIRFDAAVSSEKGWLPFEPTVRFATDYFEILQLETPNEKSRLPVLLFSLTLKVDSEPLQPLPAGIAPVVTGWPLLKITLRQQRDSSGEYITTYQPLQKLQLARVHLTANVDGLPPTHLQNDNGTLNPEKPFQPFGSQAVAGSRFYIGHPELTHKQLDQLWFHYAWKGAPSGLTDHTYYKTYFAVGDDNWNKYSFEVAVDLLEKRQEIELGNSHALFPSAAETQQIMLSDGKLHDETSAFHPLFLVTQASNLLRWPRYVRWELQPPGFMHDVYPRAAMQKATALAVAISGEGVKADDEVNYQVNPPYTPEMKWLTIGYKSTAEIVISSYDSKHTPHTVFHVHPFGYNAINPTGVPPTTSFLPAFDFAGELYIGIENLRPPQNLSLLFQLAEGTANPDRPRQDLSWSYLSGNQWLTLQEGGLLADGTRGLINSGIVKFALDPAAPNTQLSPDLYWLRVAIPRYTDSVCDVIAIHTQAISATFVDQNNAADHLSQPLPAGTIADLAAPRPQIAGVRQPYTSYGGKVPEHDALFYTRISERLRHKGRAQNAWDYEHLVLDQFPEIYKAKCLPATRQQPGEVRLVVIPDIRNKLPADPFAPKASADLIADIEAYLRQRMPTFAVIKVQNAIYRPVKVRMGVRFREGFNPGFYKQQLNDDLNRFLSPWAYGETADVTIGGRIYANTLVNFIDERPYIDYVAQIALFTIDDVGDSRPVIPAGELGYWVETSRPDEVLVAFQQHEIDLISDDIFIEENFTGINYMRVELDFIVG